MGKLLSINDIKFAHVMDDVSKKSPQTGAAGGGQYKPNYCYTE